MSGAEQVRDIPETRRWIWQVGILAGLLLVLYHTVLQEMVFQWWEEPDYSHGFLVPLVSAYFVWVKRKTLAEIPACPDRRGLLLLIGGIGLFFLGQIGAELFLMRSSLIVVISGLVLYLRGWRFFKQLLFPIGFLIFMIPLPAIIFNAVAFPLQLLAARTATYCLQLMEVPVLREGNLIYLTTSIMDVTEACSGIRSLMSLLALGTLFAYLSQGSHWWRAVMIVSTVPIAILANAFRVTGTGFLAEAFGSEIARGFYHTFSGWVVFLVAFGLLLIMGTAVNRWTGFRKRRSQSEVSSGGSTK